MRVRYAGNVAARMLQLFTTGGDGYRAAGGKDKDMATRKVPMKLYVWEDVLCDYTSGMIVALARNIDHAHELAAGQLPSVRREMVESGAIVREVSAHPADAFVTYVYGGS